MFINLTKVPFKFPTQKNGELKKLLLQASTPFQLSTFASSGKLTSIKRHITQTNNLKTSEKY